MSPNATVLAWFPRAHMDVMLLQEDDPHYVYSLDAYQPRYALRQPMATFETYLVSEYRRLLCGVMPTSRHDFIQLASYVSISAKDVLFVRRSVTPAFNRWTGTQGAMAYEIVSDFINDCMATPWERKREEARAAYTRLHLGLFTDTQPDPPSADL